MRSKPEPRPPPQRLCDASQRSQCPRPWPSSASHARHSRYGDPRRTWCEAPVLEEVSWKLPPPRKTPQGLILPSILNLISHDTSRDDALHSTPARPRLRAVGSSTLPRFEAGPRSSFWACRSRRRLRTGAGPHAGRRRCGWPVSGSICSISKTGQSASRRIHMRAIDPRLAALNEEATPLADRVIAAGEVAGDARLAAALARVDALGAEVNAIVRTRRAGARARQAAGLVGGDHSTPFGRDRGLRARYPRPRHPALRRARRPARWPTRASRGATRRSCTTCVERLEASRASCRSASATCARRSTTRSATRAGACAAVFDHDWAQRAARGATCARSCAPHARAPAGRRSTSPSTSTASTRRCARTPARRCPAAWAGTTPMALARRAGALGAPAGRPRPERGRARRARRRPTGPTAGTRSSARGSCTA